MVASPTLLGIPPGGFAALVGESEPVESIPTRHGGVEGQPTERREL